MKNTLVVPIDFTPVSHEALLFACELAVKNDAQIVAVHVLDSKFNEQGDEGDDEEVRKMVQLYNREMILKTKGDLDNFLDGMSVFYGDRIRPLIAFGTIYDAFNKVAAEYEAPLIVMGTHGIIGMQQVFGSKAYKVIVNSPIPFLVVQERSYNPIEKVYVALKDEKHLHENAEDIKTISSYFGGEFVVNVLSCDDIENISVPDVLCHLNNRIQFIKQDFQTVNFVDTAHGAGANAMCVSVDETENTEANVYGMKQDRILVNAHKMPVLCLPNRSK